MFDEHLGEGRVVLATLCEGEHEKKGLEKLCIVVARPFHSRKECGG